MRKLTLLVGMAIGYVLGSRAGRQRYEQIRDTAIKVKDDPRVQDKVHQATDYVAEKAPVVRDTLVEKAGDVAAAATSAVDRATTSDSAREDAADGDLNPDRIKLSDAGPQGDLP